MSRTITSLNGSSGSRNLVAISPRRALLRMCRCHSGPSLAEPVMITLTNPSSSPSPCPLGAQRDDLVVERHRDRARHGDDHALAVDARREPRLEVLDDVRGDAP